MWLAGACRSIHVEGRESAQDLEPCTSFEYGGGRKCILSQCRKVDDILLS